MAKGLFITSTDTGMGKTIITIGIALCLKKMGYRIKVIKPVQSGAFHNDPMGDAWLIKELVNISQSTIDISPYSFKEPLAPLVAARINNTSIEKCEVIDHIMDQDADIVIVEGAGGIMTPIGENWSILDLISDLNFPTIIVAHPYLGTVNHTVLTAMALAIKHIPLIGVILNEFSKENFDNSYWYNTNLIEQFAFTQVLGTIPYVNDLKSNIILNTFSKYINLQRIIDYVK